MQSEFVPYNIAFAVFGIFAILEILSLLIGMGLFDFMEGDYETDVSLGGFFSYINPQKIPLSMVIISFFFIFGLLGIALLSFFGLMPLFISLPIVSLFTLILLRHLTTFIGKIMPRNTTQVVGDESFISQVAIILDGSSSRGNPARAKLKDIYGSFHYIRVEPLLDEDIFLQDDEVIIISKQGSIFLVQKRLS